jgi:hypothetical protein
MATVVSDGSTLPLHRILRGKRRRCLSHLRGIEVYVAHLRCWQLDSASSRGGFAVSHGMPPCEEVRRTAVTLRIDLVSVSAGGTGGLQQCDRYVFGIQGDLRPSVPR